MLGTDTITLFKKQADGTWSRSVVKGVQWNDKNDVISVTGRVSVVNHVTVTFFKGTFEKLDLVDFTEEDAIFYGEIDAVVSDEKGSRISDLLKLHPKSGIIKSVNDNSNRSYLKHVKVVLV